jgi:hypothetical protein
MPGPLAHWAVAKDVAWRFINGPKPGNAFFTATGDEAFERISKYLYLGAAGPDVPYFYDADVGGVIWGTKGHSRYADLFHYNKPMEFVLQSVLVSKDIANTSRAGRLLTYTLGHAMHIVTDAIVHPYVNWFARAYRGQAMEDIHRTVELHQDSWMARVYWKRARVNDGMKWEHVVPPCYTAHVPLFGGYTQLHGETKDLYEDLAQAVIKTYGSPDSNQASLKKYQAFLKEYLKDAYENFYDHILMTGYDSAMGGIPSTPQDELVHHRHLCRTVDYLADLLQQRSVNKSEQVCEAVIALANSGCAQNDQDAFRGKARNWNLDTGYWIDVFVDNDRLHVVWRHTWC